MEDKIFGTNNTLINRYKIESYLAAGGMQKVYLCQDLVLNRRVVLKTPKGGVKDRRFKRGAEMSARINHANVASTFDYYEDDNLTFLIEEYIEGKDLSKRMETEFHYLDPHVCAHVIKNLAKALHEAHRMGICHRDLKPSNIMVSLDYNLSHVKLTDFGIAKLAEGEIESEIDLFEKDESTLTTSQTLLGAVPYMAPECWDDWKGAGQEMDIWALGCIAYHLISGQPPFGTGRRAIRDVSRFQDNRIQLAKPSNICRHTSSEELENDLWTIIQDCIRADPNARPTAKDILDQFDSICYSNEKRSLGSISDFGDPYRETGHIYRNEDYKRLFFHSSEFYGVTAPNAGQNVSFSTFQGSPYDRCTTILLLK